MKKSINNFMWLKKKLTKKFRNIKKEKQKKNTVENNKINTL